MSAPEPKHHDPYISPDKKLPELGALPVLVGTLLGMVFGASSLYLVLKVGLTVSASIPVAVISITLFKLLARFGMRPATILENNIVQTAGSAGESIAFGVGVTMPAILILGFDLEVARVTLVAVLGGLLGILMMIPLRRALIVDQHGILKYPEGTACAEVLKAGDSAATDAESQAGAKTILIGFLLGLFYKAAMVAGKLWKDVPEKIFGAPLKTASISAEISPELLGVGYIIGPQISGVMAAGGVLAYLVLIPLISFFGSGATDALAPGTIPIAKMGPDQIRGAYILYIGAGAVAAGGIVSMARSLPTIISGFRAGLRDLLGRNPAASADRPQLRTDHDLPMKYVAIGSIVLLAGITLAPQLHMNLLGAILILLLGFLFVTVSSRLTGEIGSSSNPISGMTVATLLLTCGVFLAIGWTGKGYYVTALSVGAIVCIAASNGGTTSQDLKTGFLIGATPSAQQISILFGALASALVLGPILLVLNDTATVYVPQKMTIKDDAGIESTRENFTPTLHVDPASLSSAGREGLKGAQAADDNKTYLVWQKEDTAGGPAGKYLVDDSGTPIYYVDPGINGTFKHRPDGSRVQKFDAPKATLMSYIIKGILNRQLPWGLVLLGALLALVLELSMIPSLAFAVGVYLPISSSTPILVGGIVRWLIDRRLKQQNPNANEEELTALGDKSPGVLMASGYIAGGAIAGIIIAVVAGAFGGLQTRIEDWATKHNPFVGGAHADALSMLPFVAIAVTLYLAGRRK